MPRQHFPCDLRIAGLVCADQANHRPTQVGNQSITEKEGREAHQRGKLSHRCGAELLPERSTWQVLPPIVASICDHFVLSTQLRNVTREDLSQPTKCRDE